MGVLLPILMVTTMAKKKKPAKQKKGKKKATKRKYRGHLPQTVTVSVSTTFVVKDLIEDVVEGYVDWDDDIEAHKASVGMSELIDFVLERAYEELDDQLEDWHNLQFTDEHGQRIKVD